MTLSDGPFQRRVFALADGQLFGLTQHDAVRGDDRFDPARVGLDHVGFGCSDRGRGGRVARPPRRGGHRAQRDRRGRLRAGALGQGPGRQRARVLHARGLTHRHRGAARERRRVLGQRAHPDQPGGHPLEHREPLRGAGSAAACAWSASSSAVSDASSGATTRRCARSCSVWVTTVGNVRRRCTDDAAFATAVGVLGPQRPGKRPARGDRVLDREVDADPADRRHRVRRVAEAEQPGRRPLPQPVERDLEQLDLVPGGDRVEPVRHPRVHAADRSRSPWIVPARSRASVPFPMISAHW